MERGFDERLIEPRSADAVALSIDSRVQAAMEPKLAAAVHRDGAGGMILDMHTGEIVAMASAPTFPNSAGRSDPSAVNRATMGVYELGSTFKPITVAMAMEAGVGPSMAQVGC